jgi:hypothetical protein
MTGGVMARDTDVPPQRTVEEDLHRSRKRSPYEAVRKAREQWEKGGHGLTAAEQIFAGDNDPPETGLVWFLR